MAGINNNTNTTTDGDHVVPFEWLTNFTSLSHLLDPNFLFPSASSAAAAAAAVPKSESNFELDVSNSNDDTTPLPVSPTLTVLHVGCGSSILGELLQRQYCTRYRTVVNVDNDRETLIKMKQRWNYRFASWQKMRQVEHDEKMKHAKKEMETGKEAEKRKKIKQPQQQNYSTLIVENTLQFKYSFMDFTNNKKQRKKKKNDNDKDGSDEQDSAAAAATAVTTTILDPFNDDGDEKKEQKEDEEKATESDTNSNNNNNKKKKDTNTFDLIVDKSTLDCLLCGDDGAARLLCQVYDHLKPPKGTSSSSNSNNDTIDTGSTTDSGGGVYFVISFHPVDFILPLLQDCPGTNWDVTTHVVPRSVESPAIIKKRYDDEVIPSTSMSTTMDTINNNNNNNNTHNNTASTNYNTINYPNSNNTNNDDDDASLSLLPLPLPFPSPSPSPSAWASGTFQPGVNYGKTVNVFICRRRRCSSDNSSSSSSRYNTTYSDDNSPNTMYDSNVGSDTDDDDDDVLNFDDVRHHVHAMNDNYFQKYNPMVTHVRKEELKGEFTKEVETMMMGKNNNNEKNNNNTNTTSNSGKSIDSIDSIDTNVDTATIPITNNGTTTISSSAATTSSVHTLSTTILPLRLCYKILFTDAEKEQLSYEYFMEDWIEYCRKKNDDGCMKTNGMTYRTAVDFLEMMQ